MTTLSPSAPAPRDMRHEVRSALYLRWFRDEVSDDLWAKIQDWLEHDAPTVAQVIDVQLWLTGDDEVA